MSTRATYRFIPTSGDFRKVATTLYIHYDGYPEGGGVLLRHADAPVERRYGRADDSGRRARRDHGRTRQPRRHRVHLRCDWLGPTARLTARDANDNTIFDGLLHEFIATRTKYCEDFKPFKTVKMPYREQVMNETMAKQYLESEYGPLTHLRLWVGKFEGSGNWKSQPITCGRWSIRSRPW